MSLAELVITSVKLEGRTKSEVARDYRVSRYWVQQLVKRYEAEGEAAFQPRSRRPHGNARAISADLEDRIIRLRKDLQKKGTDAGAETIRVHLQRDSTITRIPSVSTIWRVLSRRGFVTPNPANAPRAPAPASRPPSPTSAGRPTSPTGSSSTAPSWRSSTSKTTTPASTCALTPG